MLAYVHLVRRIGEHRRENIFFRGSSLEKIVFFIFARNFRSLIIGWGEGGWKRSFDVW